MTARTVVKLGGSLLEEDALRARALDAVASAFRAGSRPVVVHGGGKRIERGLAALGLPKRVHAGLRVTDAATLEVVVSVLAGTVNKELVAELSARGVPAAGFSGADGGTLIAEPHPPVDGVDLGRVGRIVSADPTLLRAALEAGFLPVIASIALESRSGPDRGCRPGWDGGLLNVNADDAAAAVAAALGAARLVFLTDVEGVRLADGGTAERLTGADARGLLAGEIATGGMRRKLLASLDAMASGIPEVVIAGPDRHGAALARGEGGTRLVAA